MANFKKLTQHEIANLVGVSQPVVSSVLNGKDSSRCSEEKKLQILAYAKNSGYRPNRQALLLREGKSHQIGLVQNIRYAEVSEKKAEALAIEIKKAGYDPTIVHAQWYVGREKDVVANLLDSAVEGVIFLSAHQEIVDSTVISELKKYNIPVVSLSGMHDKSIPQVHANVAESFFELTTHCIQLGRKHLVLGVSGEENLLGKDGVSIQLKREINGFIRAIRREGGIVTGPIWDRVKELANISERNVSQKSEIVGHILYSGVGWYYDWERPIIGRKLAERMCREYPETDALICRSDDLAIGAMQYCVERGITIGKELSITGYDDTVAGQYSTIPLTTVRQPIQKMAKQAVDLLLDLMNGIYSQDNVPFIISDAGTLIVRNSCGANKQKELTL